MKESWVLSERTGGVASLVVGEGRTGWVVANDGSLFRLEPGHEPVAATPPLQGDGARLLSAVAATDGRLWLLWKDGSGSRHAGLWDPLRPGPVTVEDFVEPPRVVGGPDREGAVWSLGMDTGLRRRSGGREERVDSSGYNALLVSADGGKVLARRVGSDDVVLMKVGSRDWQVVRPGFGGELVGFGQDDQVLLLEMAVWRKGGPEPINRVLSVRAAGPGSEVELVQGSFLMAAAAGRRLLTAHPGMRGTVVIEEHTIP